MNRDSSLVRLAVLFSLLFGTLIVATAVYATPNGTPPGLDKCHDSNGVALSDADAAAVCKSYAEGGHSVAICGGICANEAEAEAKAFAICGDVVDFCAQGQLQFSLAVTKQECEAANQQSVETATSCGSAAQVCGDVAVACPAAPQCPDIQPVCAKWRYKYNQKGALVKQTCKRWVVPVTR